MSPDLTPALIEDAMREIFLRVPADDPQSLVRAAAVCTSWQSILSDVVFTRQYRAFHGAPPMLGFLYSTRQKKGEEESKLHWVSNFVSTASFRPPAAFHERRDWHALDSRHGLALVHTPKKFKHFVICDLVTYDQWTIKINRECSDIIWRGQNHQDKGITWNAAVLCAKDRCDHLYCHGSPFLVALVGCHKKRKVTFASVYSSKTGKWSDMISIQEPHAIEKFGHIAVLGDRVYLQCEHSESVVEYNIGEQKLSVFDPPYEDDDDDLPYALLVGVEDGMLLFGNVQESRLYLWSMEAGSDDRADKWARRRVIELEPVVIPPHVLLFDVSVVGFAEGGGVIFLITGLGLYTIELNSGRSENVGRKITSVEKVMPYMSFYTRAWGRLPTSDSH